MAQSTVLLIINPVAGMMRGKAAMFPVVNTFCRNGYRVTTYVTARHGDARDIAYEEASSYDLVVCCGGDGTLNEVIDGILGGSHKTPLGYIPMGSTNDFANSLKLSSQPIKATQSIVNGSEKAIDVGLFNKKRHFTYIASFGALLPRPITRRKRPKTHWDILLIFLKVSRNCLPYRVMQSV